MSSINATNIISLKDFRNNVQKYADMVEDGDTFVVMKRSEPIFKVVSPREEWEEIDLTDENDNGMPIEEFKAILEKVIAEDENGRRHD
ncbi:MAG: type II toxin-antitoxin system prevent-host-death family antitoxin [Candidatus Nomurabacteria bacterium]|jgi:prevent-host-death family protein|nr:type II toxin-antitoxin system prevent-host-death family antitoxin [Candidatus Nomurabacteria bacterium]